MKIQSFRDNISAFHYSALLQLLETAIESGEFSGGKTFDQDAIVALRDQGQDFSNLALASAGQRVTPDSINRPLSLLGARFDALLSEVSDFSAHAGLLLSVLKKDTVLIEQLLFAAALQTWCDSKPQLQGSVRVSWDYGMGQGGSAPDIPLVDPENGLAYDSRPSVTTFLDTTEANPKLKTGLAAPADIRTVPVKSLSWKFVSAGEVEELYGSDWAKLSLLEKRPLIHFSGPSIEVVAPGGVSSVPFHVSGSVPGGFVPVFVRTFFEPRRNQTTIAAVNAAPTLTIRFPVKAGDQVYLEAAYHTSPGTDGQLRLGLTYFDGSGNAILDHSGNSLLTLLPSVAPNSGGATASGVVVVPADNSAISTASIYLVEQANTVGSWTTNFFRVHTPLVLSQYSVDQDNVKVFNDTSFYYQDQNFVLGEGSKLTLLQIPDGISLQARFTEQFPAYQCSINEHDWSPTVMFDSARPYADSETEFFPIAIGGDSSGQKTLLPITDELGNPTGMFITLSGRPLTETLLKITIPADPVNVGAMAVLEIELERPTYLNALQISPFSTFPVTLKTVEAQEFNSGIRRNVFRGSIVVDKPTTMRFERQLIRKVLLTFFQENYSLKEHQVEAGDALRREALNNLQSALPFNVRRTEKAVPQRFRGAQYEFGIEGIAGQDWTSILPGVFISGPHRFNRCPELIRIDADLEGTVELYLLFRAYDVAGNIKDAQLEGIPVANGQCLIFPFSSSAPRNQIDHCDVYLKTIHRTPLSLIERFLIQVVHV